jgi:hypothetical protein
MRLETGHFSYGRTGALVGGVIVAAGALIAALADDPEPLE